MIPGYFIERIIRIRGAVGEAWLNKLHLYVQEAEQRWQFNVQKPFELSYNYVAPVLFDNKTEGVLKICLPGDQYQYELNTLSHYDGRGMCKLIDSDPAKGILVLERLQPGLTLKTIRDEDRAISAAAELIDNMQSIKSLPHFHVPSDFLILKDGLRGLQRHFHGTKCPIPEAVVSKAERLQGSFSSAPVHRYLLHGDFHQENILSAGRGWKLIDPKGIIGEAAYEVFPFLANDLNDRHIPSTIKTRAVSFARKLHLDVGRIYQWGLCRAVLSIWWDIEDNLEVSEESLQILKVFDELTT